VGLQRPSQARITAGAGLSGGRISHHDQRWGITQWISTIRGLGWRTPGRGGGGITRQARLKVRFLRAPPLAPPAPPLAPPAAALGGCCNGTMKFLNNR
jgi:hypothetical protein